MQLSGLQRQSVLPIEKPKNPALRQMHGTPACSANRDAPDSEPLHAACVPFCRDTNSLNPYCRMLTRKRFLANEPRMHTCQTLPKLTLARARPLAYCAALT